MSALIPDELLFANLSSIDGEILLPAAQVSRLLGKSAADLAADRDAHVGIPYVQHSPRGAVMYRVQDVRAYLQTKTGLSGSDLDQRLAAQARATDR
ncbi:hypothetical protein KDW61_20890 [Burkholderia cenocepacia]|uniref:hypothetical protein n=1 Tax=Burkholderia cenocepacia TaxID=95486 RepID=UPI001B9AE5A5|nr:hypothetical protein [Burkholderia cenocepacia]MBR8211121.1 hypothetical protein [Burkholderia cenocepacia]